LTVGDRVGGGRLTPSRWAVHYIKGYGRGLFVSDVNIEAFHPVIFEGEIRQLRPIRVENCHLLFIH
jgi:hypothetical protein